MTDITDVRLLYLKAFLFLVAGVVAAAVLILENPSLRFSFLLFVAVFCVARFYYFAFYVITHYIDSEYRFAGLGSFVAYVLRQARKRRGAR